MEFIIILILVAIVAYYFLQKPKSSEQTDDKDIHHVDATFVCDECGERECICREEKKE